MVVLVCYLDDSGKDPQNPITTLAGYVATEKQWEAFELAVEPWFTEFGVNVLHAKDLHNTDGEFKGWRVLKKQAFVARVCQAMTPNLVCGFSMSILKSTYRARTAARGRKPSSSAYATCFVWIVDKILRHVHLGRMAHTEGLAFILECGNENNADVEKQFDDIRRIHNLDGVLRSISAVPKNSCRAIQVADLLAFYSRRRGVESLKKGQNSQPEFMMNLIAGSVPLWGYVATDVSFAKGRLS